MSKPKDKKTRVLSSLYNYTSTLAESHAGQHRGIAAGTAATLLGMGLDRVERTPEGGLRAKDGSFEYSEEQLDEIRAMALSAEEQEESKTQEQSHFVDRFMERLIQHTIPQDSPELEYIQLRIQDPSRSKKPALSIRVLSSNMKRLSAKMGAFFKIQYGLIHVITWRKPTKTLSVLVLYTCLCLWPHLVLAFPALFLLFGMIIPAYLYRHPMGTPELLKVKRRGQSLLEFFNQSDDSSVLLDLLSERNGILDDEMLVVSISSSTDTFNATNRPEMLASLAENNQSDELEKDQKDHTKFVKSQVSLFMNMRDLQNLTTDLLNGMEKGEQLLTDVIGFRDERLTTFLFYNVIAATSVILFLGKYIPWRMIFIFSGWAVIGLCHPNSKKYLVSLQKKKKKKAQEKVEPEVKVEVEDTETGVESAILSFNRHDIIVDDPAEIKMVEIFELQVRDVLKHQWKFYAYSKRLFNLKDTVRASGKKPHGVDNLGKVFPPPEWKFDFGYASNWRIDTNPEAFLHVRAIDQKYLKFEENDIEGWIYDSVQPEDSTVEFRRRRLYRECYRYARPPKKISFA